jgi:hypothetical protein
MTYDSTRDTGKDGNPFSNSARRAVAVVPHDSNDLTEYAIALDIGGGGDITVIPIGNADDAPVTLYNRANGSLILLGVRRVKATGTTATNIVAYFP